MLDRETILQARKADLVQYLRARGYELQKEGQNYRVNGYSGIVVQGNHWKDFAENQGGNTLDFLLKVMGLDFRSAVEELTGVPKATMNLMTTAKKKLIMPDRAPNEKRVIAYLTKTRGLPREMVVQLIKNQLLYQDQRGNCVFVCRDQSGQEHGAIISGTLTNLRYKKVAQGTDVSYPWAWPGKTTKDVDLLTVCESPIDAISLAYLRPHCRLGHLIGLGGLHWQGIDRFLNRNKNIKRVVIAVDDDEPGRLAASGWKKELSGRGYKVWNIVAEAKDWNEMLRARMGILASF